MTASKEYRETDADLTLISLKDNDCISSNSKKKFKLNDFYTKTSGKKPSDNTIQSLLRQEFPVDTFSKMLDSFKEISEWLSLPSETQDGKTNQSDLCTLLARSSSNRSVFGIGLAVITEKLKELKDLHKKNQYSCTITEEYHRRISRVIRMFFPKDLEIKKENQNSKTNILNRLDDKSTSTACDALYHKALGFFLLIVCINNIESVQRIKTFSEQCGLDSNELAFTLLEEFALNRKTALEEGKTPKTSSGSDIASASLDTNHSSLPPLLNFGYPPSYLPPLLFAPYTSQPLSPLNTYHVLPHPYPVPIYTSSENPENSPPKRFAHNPGDEESISFPPHAPDTDMRETALTLCCLKNGFPQRLD